MTEEEESDEGEKMKKRKESFPRPPSIKVPASLRAKEQGVNESDIL